MIAFVQLYRSDINVFEQNIELQYIKPFDELYEKGEEGFKIMQALYMAFDLKSSFYSQIPNEDERKKDVAENYIGDPDFEWSEWGKYVRAYKDNCRSVLQKKMDILRVDIDEREAFWRTLSYDDEEDRKLKNDMMSDHDDYLKKYKELEELVNQEIEELESYGGYIKSWLETLALEESKKKA